MAGRPRGAWANKAWRDALRVAVLRPPDEVVEPKTNLEELVQKLIAAGKTGDMTALKELGDRLDGKPAQAIVGGDEDDNPIAFQFIELVAVKPSESAD
jgi:hypothetical protein